MNKLWYTFSVTVSLWKWVIVLKLIKKYLETRIGKYAFYFQDLESGYVYGFNEDDKMTAAGCMKLCIAIAVIK